MSQELIQPPQEDPTEKEIQKFWSEIGRDLVRNSTQAVDETARQVLTVAGILTGLYANAIAFSDLRSELAAAQASAWVYLLPLVAMLLSLSAALLVFVPNRYPLELRSWRSAKIIHSRALRAKYWLLMAASFFLALSVAALLWAFFSYLMV